MNPKIAYNGHPDQQFGHISFAQHGDDFMILNLFRLLGVEKPNYLDLGAHHPMTISNTCLLYKLGARGVNVEANPSLYDFFRAARPDDVNVNIGVGPEEQVEATFYKYSETSGRNTFSPKEVAAFTEMEVREMIKLPVKTINQIVIDHCSGRFPKFLSCDIEGYDYLVLKSADFEKHGKPMVICVETRKAEGTKMKSMLDEKGFFCYCRMGENLFFVDKDYHAIVY